MTIAADNYNRLLPDYVQGLQSVIEAMQLIVPDINFLAGLSAHQCYGEVLDFHEPELDHRKVLKRPASIAEALRASLVDNLEDGGYDPQHPPMTRLWLGALSLAVESIHNSFPYLDLEFGFVDGSVVASLSDPDNVAGYYWNVELPRGATLADAIRALETKVKAAFAERFGRKAA